jgi:hypothetical protein
MESLHMQVYEDVMLTSAFGAVSEEAALDIPRITLWRRFVGEYVLQELWKSRIVHSLAEENHFVK